MDDRELLEARTDDIEREVARIADEFRAGFEHVAQIDRPAVALFGSARVGEDHPAYVAARRDRPSLRRARTGRSSPAEAAA